jgi:hypothetical protein
VSKFITIETKGFKDVENFYRSLNKNSQAAMKIEITDMAQKVKADMQRDAPVDVARLKNSISYEQKGLSVEFVAQTDYAAYMEFGTKKKVNVPSWVGGYAAQFKGKGAGGTDSFLAISNWVKNKGIAATYSIKTQKKTKRNKAQIDRENAAAKSIWWHIMKNGVKPHPFFFTTKNGQNRIELIKKGYLEALKQGLKNVQP